MNSRERVLKAFRIMDGNPDRVPLQFDLCKEHLEHFSKKHGLKLDYTNSMYEDVTFRISANELRTKMGSDVVIVGPQVADDFEVVKENDGTWFNEYGMKMRQGSIYVDILGYPLKDISSAGDVESYTFPDVNAPGRFRNVEKDVKKFKDDYIVIGDIEVTIFAMARQLVGMEKFLIDMALEEDYIEPLLRKITDFQIEYGLAMIERGVDALWSGDDFGSQQTLLFSEEMFHNLFKPHYERMLNAFKEAKPDIILCHHTDGAVSKLLNSLADIGYHVFNPVQPGVPGHEEGDLKEKFGKRLVFWGAIDQQDLLPRGSDEELETDIKEKLNILGEGRGYMIAPAHIIQRDVTPLRVEKFIELALKHGKYKT